MVEEPTGDAVAEGPDLATSSAWPRFGPAAAQRGMGAVMSTALLPGARPPCLSGALNIYAHRPGGLEPPAGIAAPPAADVAVTAEVGHG